MRQLTPLLTASVDLGVVLRQFAARYRCSSRLEFDPVEFPRRYINHDDIEVVGLIAAALAYGRADVFKSRIERVLQLMDSRPAEFAREFARRPSVQLFSGIRYRFNEPADFAALVAAIGWMSSEHRSLGARFGALVTSADIRRGLAQFAHEFRTAPPVGALLRTRGMRGLRYLLPNAAQGGACKRWHLYLRWMVRGPNEVDLGIWRDFVPTAALLIPLDTHIARISKYLGLTSRSDLSWRTAQEITERLRSIDPLDPVRFDFALCHHGMSGACPPVPSRHNCVVCPLRRACGASAVSPRPRGRSKPEPVFK